MTYDEWKEKYKPVTNHLNNDDQIFFETFGDDLAHVVNVAKEDPRKIWTIVDGDDSTYIINGYHLVNRINYIITEVPFEGDHLAVRNCSYDTEAEPVKSPAP